MFMKIPELVLVDKFDYEGIYCIGFELRSINIGSRRFFLLVRLLCNPDDEVVCI